MNIALYHIISQIINYENAHVVYDDAQKLMTMSTYMMTINDAEGHTMPNAYCRTAVGK